MAERTPIKIAILWHMHQPNYLEAGSSRMVLPWVRLHALKDYLDMPLTAAKYKNIKTTFNLVPSLLDQLECYRDGGYDRHLELSRINSADLTDSQKREMLTSFFSAHKPTMIEPHRRYYDLYRKAGGGSEQSPLPALFSSEEMRDLQVWSNLCWIDPTFTNEEPVKSLLQKKRHFSEEEKLTLLEWQNGLMSRIIPTYRELFANGQIDISFTPYYHPILPLLCDTNIALESTPNATLPRKRFVHPEDARQQIRMSAQKFNEVFDRPLVGMWPSEGSVSEEVARLMIDEGIKWIATDEEVRYCSLKKSGQPIDDAPLQAAYDFGPGLKIFFRDHALSDRIGFVYSSWDADKAAADFLEHILAIRNQNLNSIDRVVIPVILDGENAWEYFPNDGNDFLNEFYRLLEEEPLIETITLTEAAENIQPKPLKSLFAGSWINHNFRIWIGHEEDNAAWDALSAARDRLVQFESDNPGFDPDKIKQAWKQIYIAEGSDWCWWYGDEHRGSNNEQFDQMYRSHLMSVYEILGLEIPFELRNPIYRGDVVYESMKPDSLLTPQIDGRLNHFYEWSGAGIYDCLKSGSAMHRVDSMVSRLFYGYDHDNVYIRLDFTNKKSLDSLSEPRFVAVFEKPDRTEIELRPPENSVSSASRQTVAALDEIFEAAVSRSLLFPKGAGIVEFSIVIFDGDQRVEAVPGDRTISFDIPELNLELFWPV